MLEIVSKIISDFGVVPEEFVSSWVEVTPGSFANEKYVDIVEFESVDVEFVAVVVVVLLTELILSLVLVLGVVLTADVKMIVSVEGAPSVKFVVSVAMLLGDKLMPGGIWVVSFVVSKSCGLLVDKEGVVASDKLEVDVKELVVELLLEKSMKLLVFEKLEKGKLGVAKELKCDWLIGLILVLRSERKVVVARVVLVIRKGMEVMGKEGFEMLVDAVVVMVLWITIIEGLVLYAVVIMAVIIVAGVVREVNVIVVVKG
jgi:hypothetical protein